MNIWPGVAPMGMAAIGGGTHVPGGYPSGPAGVPPKACGVPPRGAMLEMMDASACRSALPRARGVRGGDVGGVCGLNTRARACGLPRGRALDRGRGFPSPCPRGFDCLPLGGMGEGGDACGSPRAVQGLELLGGTIQILAPG